MTEAPIRIRAHQAEQVLEVAWEGGPESRLPYRKVRGACPCATCRDEWTGERLLDPATIRPDLKLAGLEPIGNYAVRPEWNDGHSSGLFTWDLLRSLAESPPG
ncbi:MAG: DUF971 domain-containing protein [Isosphaeraceae bacterium]